MRNAIIAAIAIVIIGLIAYVIFKPSSAPSPAAENQPAATANATTTDQVQGQEVTIGTGKQATPGSVISVLYVGKLADGTVFDSSAAHGNQPLVFTLGVPGIIPGFQIGVNGMKEGGERLIAIPPSLAYGNQKVGAIPANSTIIFDVKLVKVQAATSTTGSTKKTQ